MPRRWASPLALLWWCGTVPRTRACVRESPSGLGSDGPEPRTLRRRPSADAGGGGGRAMQRSESGGGDGRGGEKASFRAGNESDCPPCPVCPECMPTYIRNKGPCEAADVVLVSVVALTTAVLIALLLTTLLRHRRPPPGAAASVVPAAAAASAGAPAEQPAAKRRGLRSLWRRSISSLRASERGSLTESRRRRVAVKDKKAPGARKQKEQAASSFQSGDTGDTLGVRERASSSADSSASASHRTPGVMAAVTASDTSISITSSSSMLSVPKTKDKAPSVTQFRNMEASRPPPAPSPPPSPPSPPPPPAMPSPPRSSVDKQRTSSNQAATGALRRSSVPGAFAIADSNEGHRQSSPPLSTPSSLSSRPPRQHTETGTRSGAQSPTKRIQPSGGPSKSLTVQYTVGHARAQPPTKQFTVGHARGHSPTLFDHPQSSTVPPRNQSHPGTARAQSRAPRKQSPAGPTRAQSLAMTPRNQTPAGSTRTLTSTGSSRAQFSVGSTSTLTSTGSSRAQFSAGPARVRSQLPAEPTKSRVNRAQTQASQSLARPSRKASEVSHRPFVGPSRSSGASWRSGGTGTVPTAHQEDKGSTNVLPTSSKL